MSEKTEQQLENKDLKSLKVSLEPSLVRSSSEYRKKINDLTTEINSLGEQLERWSDDNKILKEHNLDLMETVKTINQVIRGIMFQKCGDCGTVWKMSFIKKMMKNLTVDCPGCDLYIQVK